MRTTHLTLALPLTKIFLSPVAMESLLGFTDCDPRFHVYRENKTTHPNMKLTHALVSLGFARGKQEKLVTTARAVHTHLYAQPVFATPPVTAVALLAAITALEDAQAAMAQGGTAATALKNQKRTILVGVMEELADYVDRTAGGDLAVLLSSGFEARSTTQTHSPLATPAIRNVANGTSGELLVTVDAILNARSYEAEAAVIGPDGTPLEWRFRGIATGARNISVAGLAAGTVYLVRVRAVGGSTGFSDWSNPVSRMSL
jgi:hypothetical protein